MHRRVTGLFEVHRLLSPAPGLGGVPPAQLPSPLGAGLLARGRSTLAEMPAVRSETPTHEPIVTLETFVQVSTLLAARDRRPSVR